ncbi:MAG: methylated-DNA--[protein]-cysteine S-methyltransferase [Rhodospirillaceae bacterium]
MPQLSMHSPVGDITVSEEDGEIVSIDWGWARDQTPTPLLKKAKRQLDDYFDGVLEKFDLPLRIEGTPFQKQVWREMCKIPPGQTRTYGDIARRLKASAQSVGTACGRNRFPVIIPCHRVVAAAGLGGYSGAGGVETKIALLELEKALMPL